MKRLQVTMPDDVYQALRVEAFETEKSRSSIIVKSLQRTLKKQLQKMKEETAEDGE